MDFYDKIKQFSKRVENLKDNINNEEATKTSIILPFFQLLGYDIFNPNEFVPEYTADTGIKKGEKVDYAVMINGEPVILIEAKWCGDKLEKHDSQLFRYFTTTPAKFAILTNGLSYRFYTDIDEPNKMDVKPFLEFDLIDIKDNLILELKKFQKESFDLDNIYNSASELKYSNQIKQLFSEQLSSPTDSFVNYVLGEVYAGRRTQNVIDKYRDIIKKSLNNFINEIMNERIKSVIDKQNLDQEEQKSDNIQNETNQKIITTMEELEGYFIIKSLLKDVVPASQKITYKDTESYFAVLLDNNTWKWICRLVFNKEQRYIFIPDINKKGIKHNLDKVEDLHNYKDKLIEVLKRYL